MRQLKFNGNGKLSFTEVSSPAPGPGEAVIKTAVSVICGSEMGCYRNSGMPAGNPGHEAAGVVLKLGAGVNHLAVGDRVGVSPVAPCRDPDCRFCRNGRFTWCPDREFYGSFHAEEFLTSARACRKLPDDIDWETGVLITGDGLGVPYHSSTKFLFPDVETVAIFGAGPIGLGNVILQKYLGRRIIVSDVSPERLDWARKLGAGAVVNPKECDPVRAVAAWSGKGGADVAMECAGRPETVHNCLNAVKTGGQVIFNGEQGEVPISISDEFIRRDITATGSWFYHFCEFEQMLELCRRGLPVASLLSHRFAFADAPQAYALFSGGKSAKILLEY